VITDLGAVESDLGVLKTGKEADVHVLRRWVPGTDRVSTMAAKRYRSGDHRLFHRDAGYLEGRRVRKSREMRAMARRTDFGKQVIAGQWAAAEFDGLGRPWEPDLPVPYPVHLAPAEVPMSLVGALPKNRPYSRLNCEALRYPTRRLASPASIIAVSMSRRASCSRSAF